MSTLTVNVMQMTLGKRGDYAVRAVLWLALSYEGGAPVKGRSIAEATGIPEAYLSQIAMPLVKAGIIGSTAGPVGGYELRRPPEAISLLEVVEAAEGPIDDRKSVLSDVPGEWQGPGAIHDDWAAARRAFADRLRGVDFETLRRREASRREIVLAPVADQLAG